MSRPSASLCLLAVLALPLVLASPASAQDADLPRERISFLAGPILTTTGIGVGGQARFNERWSASLDLSFLPLPNIGTAYGGESVEMDSAVRSAVIMGHYHPTGGALAFGAGLYLGGHSFDFGGTPSRNTDVGNNTYTPAEIGSFVGEFTVMDGPALLLSIGTRSEGYVTGLGIGFPSGSNVALGATGPISEAGSDRAAQFQRDTDIEIRNIKDFADAWPVVVYARFGYLFGF